MGVEKKILFEKRLNEALRDEPKPQEYEFQGLSFSRFVLVAEATIVEKVSIRPTNRSIPAQDK